LNFLVADDEKMYIPFHFSKLSSLLLPPSPDPDCLRSRVVPLEYNESGQRIAQII
jgi:hypothetical protein